MKYNIIYADPPWDFGSGGVYQDKGRARRRVKDKYSTMSIDDIKMLPIKDISDDDCILFIWSTDQHLEDCISVIKSWGFNYSTVGFYWIKKTPRGNTYSNVGYWTMKNAEQCLIGTKGNIIRYKNRNNIRQLVEEIRYEHSRKPDEVRNRIVQLMGGIPRIELFATKESEGWDSIGYEIDNKDIRDALDEIIKK